MLRLGTLSALVAAGCRSPRGPDYIPSEPEKIEMLSLMVPDRIRIEPFTKITSFNPDNLPDGILAVVRPLDRLGDPVKAAGLFYFELWTYVNASGERKGEQLAFWDRTIASAEEMRLYWTKAQMYEFQLIWTGGAEQLQAGRKYILTATYRTPWDTTIRDEYVLEFHPTPDFIMETAPAE
jgi:hypothetical protein